MKDKNLSTTDLKIDLSLWVQKITSLWWVFILSVTFCTAVAQVYVRYAVPLYSSKAKFLINKIGEGNKLSQLKILTEEFGAGEERGSMNNEIEILTSRPILAKVVEEIGADVTIFSQGVFKNTEMYKTSPIRIDTFSLDENKTQFTFFVEIGYDQKFRFKLNKEDKGDEQVLGRPFKNKYGMFLIDHDKTNEFDPGLYKVNIMSPLSVAQNYKESLQVTVVGNERQSSIVEISVVDRSSEKAKDFVNTLIKVYNSEEIEFNTQVLTNTIEFIDERIVDLTVELNSVETDIELFKRENDVITPTAAESLGFTLKELRAAFNQLSSYEIEADLLTLLEKSLNENEDNLIPISITSGNTSLSGLIGEYNSLFFKRKKLSKTVAEKSMLFSAITDEIEDIKGLTIMTLEKHKATLQVQIRRIKNDISKLQKGLTNVPTVEKQLLEKIRVQAIKENLFLFLLEKKEETELTKAISTANTRVIESALSSSYPVYPQNKLVFIAAILLGITLPLFFVVGVQLFETRVDSEDVIKSITDVPILGRIAINKNEEDMIIKWNERSIRSEMFRSLRTDINFMNYEKKKQVIVVTSSLSGEGKSSTAINLGLTISFSSKKVVIIDMDLRKPKVSQYLKKENALGLSNYLAGNATIESIINNDNDNPDFDYILSGPIPPNPSELIMSSNMDNLIGKLKEKYDYVIIDTPPLGAVSDALLLRKYTTNTLFIVRHKFTKKALLRNMQELYGNDELVNPYIVINGIRIDKRTSAYGGYNLAYGSSYYVKNNSNG